MIHQFKLGPGKFIIDLELISHCSGFEGDKTTVLFPKDGSKAIHVDESPERVREVMQDAIHMGKFYKVIDVIRTINPSYQLIVAEEMASKILEALDE